MTRNIRDSIVSLGVVLRSTGLRKVPAAPSEAAKSGSALRSSAAAAATILAAASSAPAFAQNSDRTGSYWYMRDGWGHMMGWGGSMFGGIGMLLFWGVIIVAVVLLARNFTGASRPQSGSKALDVLQERYAKGEISKEDYEQRKKTLNG